MTSNSCWFLGYLLVYLTCQLDILSPLLIPSNTSHMLASWIVINIYLFIKPHQALRFYYLSLIWSYQVHSKSFSVQSMSMHLDGHQSVVARCHLGSISPTFYEQLLCMQIPKAQISCFIWLYFCWWNWPQKCNSKNTYLHRCNS